MSRILTANDVRIAEKEMAKVQGASSGTTFKTTGPPGAPARSPEEVARMSPRERLDYSRQFDQRRMPEWRDPRS